jgi:UDP-glucose 4-epimerase
MIEHRTAGRPVVSLRLTNCYGPRLRIRDARQTFLGIWIKQVLTGETITVFGDGAQRRDFTYVDDCVDAFLLAASSPAAVGQVFNLGSPEVISLMDLAALLVEVAGQGTYQRVPFPPDRKAIDIGDYFGSAAKIKRDLGWVPHINLREGLERTVAFYRQNGDQYWSIA